MPSKSEEKKAKEKPLFKFGPFEQAIAVLLVMGFANNPSLPYAILSQSHTVFGGMPDGTSTIPLFTPPMIMLVIVAYVGYHVLSRQEALRTRNKALAKAASKSSSSSSSSSSSKKPLSSSDIKSKGLPSSSSRVGDPVPKHVSGGSELDPKKDPSSNLFQQNYFLTMQGPGRPALVPFQDGLRPKAGEAQGTLWWDNVPDDAEQLMAPPVDPANVRSLMKNPYALDMIEKDLELLKLQRQRKEEEERYEKVGGILQTMLGGLLCAVDMRLGVAAIVFFLYRHFTLLQATEHDDLKAAQDDEKKELMKRISEAKKAGADKMELQMLQRQVSRL
ncbi:hypothetical protein BD324DRAFT_93915 [Kockovaella imperatae]|uniref:Uncharacterized protein n=1 Tax=Kockovaella imperatae TaxID=4999 RepID=A0A1Y1UE72_9TREE|nr:hypothetical protein BD324DRAFT_93915 [Kockovaella imperatae]ORX35375.1 hypothetical protein BD324DRAFT_93915 [Kockovaella imperatae]